MSEANQQYTPASVMALKAMVEGPMNDIVGKLHFTPLAKAMAEGNFDLVFTARFDANATNITKTPYVFDGVMVPTREHPDHKAEIARLQNELRKANGINEEQAGRIAKLEQQLGHTFEERDSARGELASRVPFCSETKASGADKTSPLLSDALRARLAKAAQRGWSKDKSVGNMWLDVVDEVLQELAKDPTAPNYAINKNELVSSAAVQHLDMLEIARRCGSESLAFTPEQAWSDVQVFITNVVLKDDVRALARYMWDLSASVSRRSAEHFASLSKATPITPDWAGRTLVVQEPPPGSEKDPVGGPIRYVEMTSIDGPSVSGTWKHGDHHIFCRYTGKCLESSNGAMHGWMISSHEMRRHLGQS